jgi:hypothetical protein
VSILSLTVKTKPQTRRSAHHPEGGRKTSLTVLERDVGESNEARSPALPQM